MGIKNVLLILSLCIIFIGCQPNIPTIATKTNLILQTTETEHFIVIAQENTTAARKKLESEYSRFYTKFAFFNPQHSTKKLEWISLGSYEALKIYVKLADNINLPWMEAYYSPLTNRVAVRNLADKTISHELAHQLSFNSGIQNKNASYPKWFTEGLATNFEQKSTYKEEWDKMKSEGKVIPMDKFIVMMDLPNNLNEIIDIYAQSWYLFDYLMRTNPRGLKEYADEINNMPFQTKWTLEKAFHKHFGEIKL